MKLGFAKEKCKNCGLEFGLLHLYFDCYVSEYSILLLEYIIQLITGQKIQITPSMLLFIKIESLKIYNLSRTEKDTILLLIVAYKNKTHIDFHGKARFVDSKSNSYHLRLINSVLTKVKSWGKTFNFPKLRVVPQKWPTGE